MYTSREIKEHGYFGYFCSNGHQVIVGSASYTCTHTSFKEFSLHEFLHPQLFQPHSHHVDSIRVHGGTQEAQLNGPQPTELSSKPTHEVDHGWFFGPKRLQGHILWAVRKEAA